MHLPGRQDILTLVFYMQLPPLNAGFLLNSLLTRGLRKGVSLYGFTFFFTSSFLGYSCFSLFHPICLPLSCQDKYPTPFIQLRGQFLKTFQWFLIAVGEKYLPLGVVTRTRDLILSLHPTPPFHSPTSLHAECIFQFLVVRVSLYACDYLVHHTFEQMPSRPPAHIFHEMIPTFLESRLELCFLFLSGREALSCTHPHPSIRIPMSCWCWEGIFLSRFFYQNTCPVLVRKGFIVHSLHSSGTITDLTQLPLPKTF